MITVKRALLSVWDKTGVVELAQVLHKQGCELISTGGTKVALVEAGLPVTDIESVSGNPEAFGGRMKTISFNVESALLFDRERDAQEARSLGIGPIDMVVCNLYPFQQVVQRRGPTDELVENLDIGGPTMVRAAAKNFRWVAAVTDPMDYASLAAELNENSGAVSLSTRERLMRKAFNLTADYDSAVASAFEQQAGNPAIRFHFRHQNELRYGENSHQKGHLYRQSDAEHSLADLELLGGKELSYNNIADVNAAVACTRDLSSHGCAVIKHLNPCGLAQGDDQPSVLAAAWASDPVSAFGSVIAFNRPLTLAAAQFLQLDHSRKHRRFVEVVVAPDYEPRCRNYLGSNPNLRIVRYQPPASPQSHDYRFLPGALLVQDADNRLYDSIEWATRQRPESVDEELVRFGIIAVRQIRSNAIAIVRRREDGILQLLGMGGGQPNRVISARLALDKCRENLELEFEAADDDQADASMARAMRSAVLFSDAFFPFADSIELAAERGIKTVFQPGGSMRDKSVVKRCDELEVALAMTGIRHFKH